MRSSHHGAARPNRRAALHPNGYNFADRFPGIVEAIANLPAQSCFTDGEAIVVDERGKNAGPSTLRPEIRLANLVARDGGYADERSSSKVDRPMASRVVAPGDNCGGKTGHRFPLRILSNAGRSHRQWRHYCGRATYRDVGSRGVIKSAKNSVL
jgi:hypothetical protein